MKHFDSASVNERHLSRLKPVQRFSPLGSTTWSSRLADMAVTIENHPMDDYKNVDQEPLGKRTVAAVKFGLFAWVALIVGLSVFGTILGLSGGPGYMVFMMAEGAMFGLVIGWPAIIVGGLVKFFVLPHPRAKRRRDKPE